LSPALCAAFLRERPPVTFFAFRWFNAGFTRSPISTRAASRRWCAGAG
jgi:hypothetical protein